MSFKSISNFIINRFSSPWMQLLGIMIFCIFSMLLAKVIDLLHLIDVEDKFYWLLAAAFLLIFSVYNSIGTIGSKKLNEYFGRSIMSFATMAIFLGLSAYLFSGLAIFDAGSYSIIFLVISFTYLIFLLMVRTMRVLIDFAMQEEWNQPKIKKKK